MFVLLENLLAEKLVATWLIENVAWLIGGVVVLVVGIKMAIVRLFQRLAGDVDADSTGLDGDNDRGA